MSLSQWDRDYIEHLIQREARLEREFETDITQALATGYDRYFWDFHLWPIKPSARDYQIARVPCPDCGSPLKFGINKPWGHESAAGERDHIFGCEFFRTEQRQWVDDWADVRREHHVLRDLTWAEATLVAAFLEDETAPQRMRMVVTDDGDGMLLRRVV